MRYELYIQVAAEQVLLDIGDESPAMNYQINTLSELKDRQSMWSQAIKLPKTITNIRALGIISEIDIVSDIPYSYHPCELLSDGITISPVGAVLCIKEIESGRSGSVVCQITSGTRDLFQRLEDASDELIGHKDWAFKWGIDRVMTDNTTASSFARWALSVPHVGVTGHTPESTLVSATNNREKKYVYDMTPILHYNSVIKDIFAKEGYDVESNLLLDSTANTIYVTASKMNNYSPLDYTKPYSHLHFGSVTCPSDSFNSDFVSLLPSRIDGVSHAGYGDNHNDIFCGMMAEQAGAYKLRIIIRPTVASSSNYFKQGYRNFNASIKKYSKNQAEAVELFEGYLETQGTGAWENEFDFDMEAGDNILMSLSSHRTGSAPPIFVTAEASFYYVCDDADSPPIMGTTLDYLACTNFKSRKEVVMTYLQLFGASINVKNMIQPNGSKKGVVEIYTFAGMYNRINAGMFLDWSDKLVEDSNSMSFAMSSYGRINEIKQEKNDDDCNAEDVGAFEINNKTLAENKTLFTLATEAGRDLTYRFKNKYIKCAVIPSHTIGDEVRTTSLYGHPYKTSTLNGCGTHVVKLLPNGIDVELCQANQSRATRLNIIQHEPIQNFIDTYYAPLLKVLDKAKVIEVELNLNVFDINGLDFFTPIYFKQFGAYFYINKIPNFIAGAVAKVEIIKL